MKIVTTPTRVGDRGIMCMFVGYCDHHDAGVFCMWNLKTNRILVTRYVIWLKKILFPPENPDTNLVRVIRLS